MSEVDEAIKTIPEVDVILRETIESLNLDKTPAKDMENISLEPFFSISFVDFITFAYKWCNTSSSLVVLTAPRKIYQLVHLIKGQFHSGPSF